MRLQVLLLCVLGAMLASGCSKKSSKEFHKLAADQESLVLRDGDEAWVSPEMDAIAAGLAAVPEDAVEKSRAVALAEKVATEKARVLAERAELEAAKAPAAQVAPPSFPSRGDAPTGGEPTPTEAPGSDDAGAAPAPVATPTQGMPEADFVKAFGACFSAGGKTKLSSGEDAAGVQVLSASADCQKRFGPTAAGGRTLYLFNAKGLAEKATEVTQVLDGGTQEIPGRQPPAPDPGPPVLSIPGAPAYPPVGQ